MTASETLDSYSNFISYLQTPSPSSTAANGDVENGSSNTRAVFDPAEEDADDPTPHSSSISNDASTNLNGTSYSSTLRNKQLSRRRSTTEERRNPFAEREGNALIWTGVNMTLSTKQGEKKILSDVWGEVPPGEITAIMGPSGAGKSSLLNVLAGRSRSTAKLIVESEIRMNEYKVDPTDITVRKQIAFVAQDDSLAFTATPREAIRFSAKLRLPRVTTDNEIEELADRMLAELGLKDCADTIIGGNLIKGISGGERKRTSVGVELVTKPSLVFLDEPTSGLDSFAAVQLIKVLKKIAHAGCSVLFTIHQPSSDVFNAFDRLILLNKGMVMYQGSVKDVPGYFAKHNHPMPPNFNPADWIMDVANQYSQEQLRKEGFFCRDERQLQPAKISEGEDEIRDALGASRHNEDPDEYRHVGFGTEVRLLFQRELKHNTRNKKAIAARFALTTFMSLLVGNIFYGVGGGHSGGTPSYTSPSTFNSHFGAVIMILMMSMFGTAMPTLLAFPEERPVFVREYSTNHYRVLAYFMSRLVSEALITFLQILPHPMVGLQSRFVNFLAIEFTLAMSATAVAVLLGCAVEDPSLATEFLPLLFVPQLLFAGFFVRTDLIPPWLRWAQYLCALTYAIRLVLLAEFGSCANDPTIIPNLCAQLFEVNQVDEDESSLYWGVLWSLFFVFRLGALILLRKKATKFY